MYSRPGVRWEEAAQDDIRPERIILRRRSERSLPSGIRETGMGVGTVRVMYGLATFTAGGRQTGGLQQRLPM